jgi:hypothetical protein
MLQLLNTPFSRQFGPYRNFVSPKRLEILLKISAVSVLSLCLPVEAQEDGGCLAFRKTAVGLITQNNSQGYKFIIPLEPDDRLAAEAAIAKLFEHLARLAQFNRGADARSDCPVREHARDLVPPCGDARGFAFPAMLCAVIWRSENHPSSAAWIVETRLPPGLRISASRRIASANDRPVRPSEAGHCRFVQVEMANNQIRRCESHPLVQ